MKNEISHNQVSELLPPWDILPQLHERVNQLMKAAAALRHLLKYSPKGHLRVSLSHGYHQFYIVDQDNPQKVRYLRGTAKDRICRLAEKDAAIQLLIAVQAQISRIEAASAMLQEDEVMTSYNRLHPERKKLVSPPTLADKEFIRQWLRVEYPQKSVTQDMFITDQGERVRSKSELIIANCLLRAGVPYRYEFPVSVNVNGRTIELHPDFYCLNVRTRQEFAWEHFGLMDDVDYLDTALMKIQQYREGQRLPACNMVYSFESRNRALSVNYVRVLIKDYLT